MLNTKLEHITAVLHIELNLLQSSKLNHERFQGDEAAYHIAIINNIRKLKKARTKQFMKCKLFIWLTESFSCNCDGVNSVIALV